MGTHGVDGPKSSPASAMSRGTGLHPFQGTGSLILICTKMPCGLAGVPALSGPRSCILRSWPINSEVHPAQSYDSKAYFFPDSAGPLAWPPSLLCMSEGHGDDVLGFLSSDLDIALGGVTLTLTLLTPFHRGRPLSPQSQGFPGCGALWRRNLSPPQGLVAIPVSVFYSQSHQKHFDHYIRFCFVKVKGRAVEGGASPNFPRPAGGCEERGRINLCWCRMNARSRPWIRSCRSGRMNSGPDVTPTALCHLVGPCTLFRVLSLSRF